MGGGGNLELSIEQLLNVEKQMRLSGEVAGTKKAITGILQLCFEARAWNTLNDQIVHLSKRHGQLKQIDLLHHNICYKHQIHALQGRTQHLRVKTVYHYLNALFLGAE